MPPRRGRRDLELRWVGTPRAVCLRAGRYAGAMADEPPSDRRRPPGTWIGAGVAIGAGLGAALFAATGSPVWIGVFVAIGVAVGAALDAQSRGD